MVSSGLPRIGFRVDPAHNRPRVMAHAAPAGHDTALCGVQTPYLGGSWPAPGHPWAQPYSRCPTCAHHLYSPDRH